MQNKGGRKEKLVHEDHCESKKKLKTDQRGMEPTHKIATKTKDQKTDQKLKKERGNAWK